MSAAATARALRPLARAHRLSLRDQWSAAFRAACANTSTTYEQVAESCGVPRQKVDRWANGVADDPLPNALHLLAMPPAVRAELRVWEASRDLVVCVPAQPDGLAHGARLALLATELSDPVRAYAVAIADGHLSRAESVDVCRELDQAIHVAAGAMLAIKAVS